MPSPRRSGYPRRPIRWGMLPFIRIYSFINLASFFSKPPSCAKIPCIRVPRRRPNLTFTLVKASAFVFMLAFCADAVAATIQGVVRDPSGPVVAKAEVTVSGAALTTPRASQTNAEGRFSVDGLAPGDYQVSVRAPGFEQFQNSVTISQ